MTVGKQDHSLCVFFLIEKCHFFVIISTLQSAYLSHYKLQTLQMVVVDAAAHTSLLKNKTVSRMSLSVHFAPFTVFNYSVVYYIISLWKNTEKVSISQSG